MTLCGRDAPVEELAPCFLHDPALALRLLSATSSIDRRAADSGWVRPALRAYSPAQIRAFALSLLPAPAESLPALHESWWRSIRVAAIAEVIAEQTGHYPSEWAWLAGLMHNVGDWLNIQNLDSRIADSVLLGLEGHGFVADAVRYCKTPLARVRTAHVLTRIVHAACAVAGSEPGASSVEGRAALAAMGMEGAFAARLALMGTEQADRLASRYGIDTSVLGSIGGSHAASTTQLIRAYSRFAAAGVFQEVSPTSLPAGHLEKSFVDLVSLVFGVTGMMLVAIDRQTGQLSLPEDDEGLPAGLKELVLTQDDPMACLAQACRGQAVRWTQEAAERYSVLDGQIARLFNAETLLYQPLKIREQVGAILVLANPVPDIESETSWQLLMQKLGDALAPVEIISTPAASPVPMPAVEQQDVIPRDQVRRAVHEVANPLTIMRNYVNLLSSKLESDLSSQRDLKIINDEIERASRILRELTRAPAEEALDLPLEEATNLAINPVISELVRLSLGTLFVPNRISVQIDLDPDIPQIPTSRDKLKQVLLNLAKNAVEAMPRGGRLIFATRVRNDITPSQLEISIRDNGPGLPDSVTNNLFEPVASTKGGDHAGLGLSISRNLVKGMGGNIECDTGQNGTEFRILLPVAPAAKANLKIAG